MRKLNLFDKFWLGLCIANISMALLNIGLAIGYGDIANSLGWVFGVGGWIVTSLLIISRKPSKEESK